MLAEACDGAQQVPLEDNPGCVCVSLLKEALSASAQPSFQLFESQQYGESDLLFKDVTRCLVQTSHLDPRRLLGEDFYAHAERVFNCTPSGEARPPASSQPRALLAG